MMEQHLTAIKSICANIDINSLQWQQLITLTCSLKDCMLVETERMKLPDESIKILTELIHHCKRYIDQEIPNREAITCVTESYRTLRNACVQCKHNQDRIHMQENLFTISNDLIQTVMNLSINFKDDTFIVTLRCIIQFLGNCASGHKENQLMIWKTLMKTLRALFCLPDDKLGNYICMVAHTCLSNNLVNDEVWTNQDTIQIVIDVITYTAEHDCDWGMFLIESVCKVENCFSLFFARLEDCKKLLVLEIMLDLVKKTEDDQKPSSSNVQYITGDVKSQSYKILSLLAQHEDQNPVVIVKEIEILGIATSHHTVYPDINNDKDLLTCIIYLLDAIHRIGKQGDNSFSSVDKVTDTVNIDKNHAGYGLKRDLIRLIGNMAYKSKANQDMIREMNCIPLVLDQTNIDGRNPYITQWSVLAIHNICKNNDENKAVLASLKFGGLADDAEVLRKYGIEAEVKDNKVIVKPPSENK